MLIRIQFRLLCPSEADATTVRDAIAGTIATRPQRVMHSAVAVAAGRDAQWLVSADVSFHLRTDADAIYSDVQAKWDSVALRNRILAGSTATLHICPHAGGEPPPWPSCRTIDYQVATKG